jgi:hypothetical protein
MMVLNYAEGLRPMDVPMFSDLDSQHCATSMRKNMLGIEGLQARVQLLPA